MRGGRSRRDAHHWHLFQNFEDPIENCRMSCQDTSKGLALIGTTCPAYRGTLLGELDRLL